jgi:hypothetical protein
MILYIPARPSSGPSVIFNQVLVVCLKVLCQKNESSK